MPDASPALAEELGLAAGDRLGSYELLAPLGKGGMGMVFRARHVRLKKDFALKVLSPRLARDREAIRRFERETEALGRLEHVHLVRASDAGVEGGTPFVVMELLDGVDLAKRTEQQGSWPVAEACEAVRQAALGLQHAFERGLVHRDIKPSNLWLTPAGVVKVLDLGLARLCGEEGGAAPMTAAGMWMGTPDYIAPEQILDSHSADTRADLYSLGCTLFHLLTGEPPFGPSTHPTLRQKSEAHLTEPPPDIRQRRPEVPAELAAVLARLLAKRPEDRYQTPAEAAAALEPFARNACLQSLPAGDAPFTAAASTCSEPLKTTLSWDACTAAARLMRFFARRWPWVAAAALLLAGGVGLAVFLSRPGGTPKEAAVVPQAIQVMKLDVRLTRNINGQPAGLLGVDVFDPHFEDTVTVEARQTRPAYAFLIAFRPDGKPEVCFPKDDDQPPPLIDNPCYPPRGDNVVYGLTDGTGLTAFAVVVSSEPLPSFKEWWSRCQGCPWKKENAPSGLIYRANGEDEVEVLAGDDRGKGAEVPGKTAIGQLAAWLRQTPGIDTVQVLGFVVAPKEKR